MQRRLIEDLQVIELNISLIKDSFDNLTFMLNKLLAAPDKSFEVVFKGIEYNFIYPTTPEENVSMIELRKKLLSEIFKEVFNQMVEGKSPWELITVFASGIDTLDMQVEIIGKDEMMAAKSDDGSNPKIALDSNNYQVKQELENDIEVPQED